MPFSLSQAHVEPGEADADEPERDSGLLALQVGVVVRDWFPEQFLAVHGALFALRHDKGQSLKDEALGAVLTEAGVEADVVFDEIATGKPLALVQAEHIEAVQGDKVWGVDVRRRRPVGLHPAHGPPDGDTALAGGPSSGCRPPDPGRAQRAQAHTTISADRAPLNRRRPAPQERPERGAFSLPGMGQPAGITDERRMSDAEGLMWRLEADPTFASSFATVTLLDQPADMERLRRRMSRGRAGPRLRQRAQDRPLGLAPVWVDVAEVDIDHHVRNVTLPAPGTLRQLLDLATEPWSSPSTATAPLGVPGRRRAGRRPGRGHPEDAPHHHRRRERHQAVAAVPRPRAPRPSRRR